MTNEQRLKHLNDHKNFLIQTIRVLADAEIDARNRKRDCSFSLSATEAQIEKLEKELKETPKVL